MNIKISDMVMEDRPRERLQRHGIGVLSDAELIALFLRTGMKGKSAIALGQDLLQHYGSLSQIGQLTVQELAKRMGFGLAKASQLIAAFELGARVARERVSKVVLNQPDKIYEHFAPILGHSPVEILAVAVLTSKLQLLEYRELTRGTVNQTLAHPRDILRPVVACEGYAFLLMHNHPSGDPSPSQADIELTKRLRECSEMLQVRFMDHVIIGRPTYSRSGYYSFREHGTL